MQLDIVATWVFVGLMSGYMAGFLIKPGGYGLLADLVLGLAGRLVGIGIFHALAMSPDAGWLVMAVVAFAGAASVLVGQRWWYTHA
jgi:uncharacterized membrane protein YeaQ/YmgE (transglycosylase-associated protein family)